MKTIIITIFALLLIIPVNSENQKKKKNSKTIKTVFIKSVKICDQIWMKRNLDVDHYRNGDSIPEVRDIKEWSNLKTGAWCYYKNDPENGKIYGKLYNFYAVIDQRGLAPAGWHVPSDYEWSVLEMCLGMSPAQADSQGWRETDVGGKLKSRGTKEGRDGLWLSPNIGTTNESDFSALPGGMRGNFFGSWFLYLGYRGYWWTSRPGYGEKYRSWSRYMIGRFPGIGRGGSDNDYGLSVRCVKDK